MAPELAAHLNTLSALIPGRPTLSRPLRIELPLPEGGVLIARADLVCGRAPTILLVHGAGGSSETAYLRRAAHACNRAGFHAVRLNCRGGGLGRGLANSHYHSGLSEDLARVVDYLAGRPRVEDVSIMGFSLGGHMSLCLAGEWGPEPPERVRGVVTISAPVDLAHAAGEVWNGDSDMYERAVVGALRGNAVALKMRLPAALPASEARLRAIRRIWEIDALVIAPLWGYRDKEDYYARANAGLTLHQVTVPTLVIHAKDDPVVPWSTVEPHLKRAGPGLATRIWARGGHTGFAEGWSARSGAVKAGIEFLLSR